MKKNINSIFFIALALLLASSDTKACEGTNTYLQHKLTDVPSLLRHDHSIGKTSFSLRSKPGGDQRFASGAYEGNWFCIGFHEATKTYIVGGVFEQGVWLPLGSIQYLQENGNSFIPSAFDRSGYRAMSVVPSPSHRYLAFIGGVGSVDALYVLDTQNDVIKKLGPAPKPPPDKSTSNVRRDEPFGWNLSWTEEYVEMDAGILRFTAENVLEVSYGKDKPHKRAKKRWTRIFKL